MPQELENLISNLVERFENPQSFEVVFGTLQMFGDNLVLLLTRNIEDQDISATGTLSDSITFRIQPIGLGFSFQLLIEDYYIFVDQGREKGKMPPVNKILEWIKAKPVIPEKQIGLGQFSRFKSKPTKPTAKSQIQAAWGIAKGIAKFGTKPTNFYSSVVNANAIAGLIDALGLSISQVRLT